MTGSATGGFTVITPFNRQRVFVDSPEATANLLHNLNAFRYIKYKVQFILPNKIAGKGFLIYNSKKINTSAGVWFLPLIETNCNYVYRKWKNGH